MINLFSGVACVAIITPHIWLYCKGCNRNIYHDEFNLNRFKKEITDTEFTMTFITFAILFLLFTAVSLRLIYVLKTKLISVYESMYAYLWIGCLTLSVPLLIRSISDVLFEYDTRWQNWLFNTDHPERNTYYSLIDFIVPRSARRRG